MYENKKCRNIQISVVLHSDFFYKKGKIILDIYWYHKYRLISCFRLRLRKSKSNLFFSLTYETLFNSCKRLD